MPSPIPNPERAAKQLNKSQRGRFALKLLEVFLDQACWSLDTANQQAMSELLQSFNEAPNGTLDAIREELGQ